MITFETTLGPIVIELFEEEAPVTSKNFLAYAESGFFNGTLFHRVIPGFVIQGGGMESGMVNKEGNPPIMNEANNGLKNLKWSLSMAIDKDHLRFFKPLFASFIMGGLPSLLTIPDSIPPPCITKPGITLWNKVPLKKPLSAYAKKFFDVTGASSSKSSITIGPSVVSKVITFISFSF